MSAAVTNIQAQVVQNNTQQKKGWSTYALVNTAWKTAALTTIAILLLGKQAEGSTGQVSQFAKNGQEILTEAARSLSSQVIQLIKDNPETVAKVVGVAGFLPEIKLALYDYPLVGSSFGLITLGLMIQKHFNML